VIKNLTAPEPLEAKAVSQPAPHFFARQPILTRDQKVFGYELLFRGRLENSLGIANPTAATRSILGSSSLIGFDILCDGRRAFINCTREILLKDYITLLPAAHTVVEVLETVPPDDLVVDACLRLKGAGYLIALDDFVTADPRECLTSLADIIKVDIKVSSPQESAAMVKRYTSLGCHMLAEKVETQAEFVDAKQNGFHYFQGYFFRKPELLRAQTIPTNRVNYLRLLQAASRPDLDPREIENIIKSEASFCYRLLRYLNSAIFGFSNGIRSVRHALSLLGEDEARRWLRLVAMLGAGQNKTSDLVLSALVRARFCELLAPKIQHDGSDLFLMGLLSLMDSILEIPMASVLESVPPDQETKEVLLGGGNRLRPFYLLMLALEAGEWQNASMFVEQLHLSENDVAEKYWQAVQWAGQVNGR
jgi:c-di-GMP-related signal transduction protein